MLPKITTKHSKVGNMFIIVGIHGIIIQKDLWIFQIDQIWLNCFCDLMGMAIKIWPRVTWRRYCICFNSKQFDDYSEHFDKSFNGKILACENEKWANSLCNELIIYSYNMWSRKPELFKAIKCRRTLIELRQITVLYIHTHTGISTSTFWKGKITILMLRYDEIICIKRTTFIFVLFTAKCMQHIIHIWVFHLSTYRRVQQQPLVTNVHIFISIEQITIQFTSTIQQQNTGRAPNIWLVCIT